MPEASESYNLHILRPDLAKQWHPTKNGTLGPKDVTPGSRKKVWWLCERGHWWLAAVSDRIRGMKCTYCRDLQKQGEQCMSDAKPELLKEWHPSRNSGLKAKEVACTHGDKVWWLCNNGHEWQATIRSRLTGKPCPFCSSCIQQALTVKNGKSRAAAKPQTRHGKLPADAPLRALHEQVLPDYQGKELRKSRRYEHVSTVMIESPQAGIFGYAQMYNYSAGGMLIRSDFAISPGTLIKVNLEKPLYSSVSKTVDSRAVWCRRFEQERGRYSRYGIGVSLI
jgi:hypothetical protein